MGNTARARMSAAWLRLLGGWEVYVLEAAEVGVALESGAPAGPVVVAQPMISVAELAAAEGAVVVDLARSVDFRAGHIAGAIWGVRTRLPPLPEASVVVVTAPNPALAHLAVPELRGLTPAPVRVLEGGTAAWRAAGLAMVADRTIPADGECIDFYLRPYDRNSGVEAAMHAYLSWEIDLVHEVARDGDARFGQV
jgi:rhodanese-related sulfurtransferase